MRGFLDPVMNSEKCSHFLDDIGIAANTVEDQTPNRKAVLECYRKTGLKLTVVNSNLVSL